MVAKYEDDRNRLACGRLWCIAQAVGKPPGWFFEGIEDG
jgi:hypothetical protein